MNAMLTLFSNEPLAKVVSRDTLKHLAQALITSVLDERIAKLQDGPQIIRTINVLVVKMIQKTDTTVCLGYVKFNLLHMCVCYFLYKNNGLPVLYQ